MAKQRTYTGHSGQMAVLAELLFRQCNVAVPEVDTGTDTFAFREGSEDVARIQVKTGQGERYKKQEGYSVQFQVPLRQLEQADRPRLHYVLVSRLEGQWVDFLVLSRARLAEYWRSESRFGTEDRQSGNLVLTVQFRPTGVRCGQVDLTAYRNAWDILPPLRIEPEPFLGAEGSGDSQTATGEAADEAAAGDSPAGGV